MIGQTLGHYRILEKLGQGGMGVVYRAQDTRLHRDVAIKVLPEAFARDPERLARFEREAQALAALNHANIAAIYGLEEAGDLRYLVLEYVPGETLRGPLPVEETLAVARQIAEAFEAAHEKGIMHRDLKPANVKVTPEGKVKVLDFGLAKALADEPASSDPGQSPTLSLAATRAGTILGTAAYMSPEQARGKRLDRRTDIWAFGCVLYELLAGRSAFGGEGVPDTLARVMEREPDWEKLPAATPAKLRELMRRCLQKDRANRLRDIGDARFDLEAAPTGEEPLPHGRGSAWGRSWLAWAVAAVAAVVAVWSLLRAPPPAPRRTAHLAIPVPREALAPSFLFPSLAFSPDGTRIVYGAARGNTTELYQRALDEREARPIPGTEGGHGPSFSADGQWLAFFAATKLKKVALSGGTPVTLADVPLGRGLTWLPDDTIIFNRAVNEGLSRVPAAGGMPQSLTKPTAGEGHLWPTALPGGKWVLFSIVRNSAFETARVAALSLETGEQRSLLQGGGSACYASSGHLVYATPAGLMAVPFDLERVAVTGPAVPVLEGVLTTSVLASAHFSVSNEGALIYRPGSSARALSLVWVDRQGAGRALAEAQHGYWQPRLSPDGQRVAATLRDRNDIWVYDIPRGTLDRQTFEDGEDETPLWMPDGKRLTYSSSRGPHRQTFWKPADGSGPEETFMTADHHQHLSSWSPDGRWLAFSDQDPKTNYDIWVLPGLEGTPGERKPRPFLRTSFNEWAGVFSPDSRWMAYTSNETGRDEVFVQPFPGPGGKWTISTDGGSEPVWARNGRELFYRNGDRMMAVSVEIKPGFSPGRPRQLFEGRYMREQFHQNYDVSPDGQRFLMVRPGQDAASSQINIVLNWSEELKRRAPPAQK